MVEIRDIPLIPERKERFEEILVDCYGQYEELSAMNVYLEDALNFPFAAHWRDPDESGHGELITVLGVADVDDRRGVLLQVRRSNGKERRVTAEQIWPKDKESVNALVLDDYRYWVEHMYGLTPGFD